MIEWMDWGLSTRTQNVLLNQRIATRDEVRSLLRRVIQHEGRVRNVGRTTVSELWAALDRAEAPRPPEYIPAEGTDE